MNINTTKIIISILLLVFCSLFVRGLLYADNAEGEIIRQNGDLVEVWDEIRHKWVVGCDCRLDGYCSCKTINSDH